MNGFVMSNEIENDVTRAQSVELEFRNRIDRTQDSDITGYGTVT